MARPRSAPVELIDLPKEAAAQATSLPDAIYQRLREAILTGHLQPGQDLRQEELASWFSTSRVPLREALQRLQAEGFVIARPRRGYAVTSLNSEEVLGILQMRILVEGYAGYIAAKRRTAEDIQEVEAILKKMERIPASPISDRRLKKWLMLNRSFHNRLFAAAKQPELYNTIKNLSEKVDPYIAMELSATNDIVDGHHYHREIHEAFKQGDADRTAILSRRHCELTAKRFHAVLREKGIFANISEDDLTDLGPAAAMLPGKYTF